MAQVSVVLPCKDEALSIGACIEGIRSALQGEDYEIIVVDNGSRDGSRRIARSMGARVVSEAETGYGHACRRGLGEAVGEYIVMGDADSTYDFSEIPLFLDQMRQGRDMVIGDRFSGRMESGSMGLLHRAGNRALNFMFNMMFGTGLSDTHCGLRAVRRGALKRLVLEAGGMEFALEMILEAKRTGLKMGEVPVSYRKRKGASKMRSFRDGLRHLLFMMEGRL